MSASSPVIEPAVRPWRAFAAASVALVSLAALLVSAALFAELQFQDWPDFFSAAGTALIPLLIGIVALGLALWWSPWKLPFLQPNRETGTGRTAWWPLGAGVLLLALGTVLGGRLGEILPPVSAHIQFAVLLAGVLVTGWALSGAPRGLPTIPRRELALVVGLTIAALVLRLLETSVIIPGLIDEVHFLNGMHTLWDDPAAPLLRQSSTFLPATILYNYWQVQAVAVLGHSLEGLRITSQIVGALTVPAVYVLARTFFDRRTALAAALLLLAFPPHLHFSRLAFAHIADPLFGTLALALFAVGLKSGKRWAWAWGGVALGMTQYFFEGGRLLYPPLVLIWFAYMLIVWNPRRMIRAHGRNLITALVAAVLIALPMYVTMAATQAPFSSRLNDSGGGSNLLDQVREYDTLDPFSQVILLRRFVGPFLSYVALPDSTGEYYGNDQPMVLPILVPLLLLGAAHSLWRPRSPALVVLMGVLAVAAGNIVMQETLWYPRYVAAMPLLTVLMAVGLRYTVPLFWPVSRPPTSPRWQKAGAAVVPVLACVALVLQVAYFFGPYREAYAVSFRASKSYRDSNDAILRAVALPDPDRTQVVLVSLDLQDMNVPRSFDNFLNPGGYPLITVKSQDFTDDFLARLPRDRGYAFFLEPTDPESYRRLAAAFSVGIPTYSNQPLLPASEEYLLFWVPPPEDTQAN
ncbi:MAG: glycosyltransferase family 39 protein [Anaerolineae bacterium]